MPNSYGELIAPDTLHIERTLPGPIERVWRYLTEADLRKQWLAAGPMELEVDGNVTLIFHNNSLTPHEDLPPEKYAYYGDEHVVKGTITACDPPFLLSYTWPMGENELSEVCFQLAEKGEKVQLQITHSRLTQADQKLSVAGGWHTHLEILLAQLESRTPPPFWSTHTKLEAQYERLFNMAE